MKKNILFMIFGMAIMAAITIGVYAINASEIDYRNTKVDQALDTLYTNQNEILSKFATQVHDLTATSWNSSSNSNATLNLVELKKNYQYLKINSIVRNTGSGTCTAAIWNGATGSAVEVTAGTTYDIKNIGYTAIYARAKSSSNAECRCTITFTLSNETE